MPAQLANGYIDQGGIAVGHPVNNSSGNSQEASEGATLRTWITCAHLDIEEARIEYPPGDPLGYYKVSFDKVDPAEKVWVMAVALGRFSFTGQQAASSPMKIEVAYGDADDKQNYLVLKSLSQAAGGAQAQGPAGSWVDFDSLCAFPWRSDMIPKLSLRIYQTGTLFGVRLPFALNPSSFRRTLGTRSMRLPFQIQHPRKIAQEVMLSDPRTSAVFGSVQMAVDFKQIGIGLLKRGGMELFTALLALDGEYLEAPPMEPSLGIMPGDTPWVLGQPMPGN